MPTSTEANITFKIMTFNLRNGNDAWERRRPINSACLSATNPDIIGTQEGFYNQIKDIAASQPQYAWIGTGRDGGSRGEFMAVFYKIERFEPLEFDHFWLSDTPNEIASSTWGNACRRMVTWVKFRDLHTGKDFYFWNTHLDHQSQFAREKSAELISQRVQSLGTDLPIILVGDFNAYSHQNKTYEILINGGFTDAWTTAEQHIGPNFASFHSYGTPIPDGPHIDWILSKGPVKSHDIQIVNFSQNGQYPSDHFPIMATVSLNNS